MSSMSGEAGKPILIEPVADARVDLEVVAPRLHRGSLSRFGRRSAEPLLEGPGEMRGVGKTPAIGDLRYGLAAPFGRQEIGEAAAQALLANIFGDAPERREQPVELGAR